MQYFTAIKSLCNEILELDSESKISESKMWRIIIRGLKPKYNGLVMVIHGWSMQSYLYELESILASQETLSSQGVGISLKNEQKVL